MIKPLAVRFLESFSDLPARKIWRAKNRQRYSYLAIALVRALDLDIHDATGQPSVFEYDMAAITTKTQEAMLVAWECADLAESHIEREYVWALALLAYEHCDLVITKAEPSEGDLPDYFLEIIPQHQIGDFRVDFFVRYGGGKNIDNTTVIVECDGHDYHETKKAAAADKKRDRKLQNISHVLRFTGSEIHRDAFGCAFETLQFLGVTETEIR